MLTPFVIALSFLGILAGVIISKFTKEELKPGKKWFSMLENCLMLAIGIVIIFYTQEFSLFFMPGLVAGFFFRRVYFYLGMALPLASESFLVALASLTFIIGLPKGTLLASELKNKDKIKKEIFMSGVFFFAAAIASYLIGYEPLLIFASGALVMSWFVAKA
ncbi:MAG: hypothetical protein Q8N77_00470 [Nanoarchaeota archaeon]|nr:hypothetical protein [Nanoarchaeota archaeon]